MNLQVGSDEENHLRANDLISLIDITANGNQFRSKPSGSKGNLRHVPRDRIHEILRNLNMKSILYSPVTETVYPRDLPSSLSVLQAYRLRHLGLLSGRAMQSRSFDLVVKSLEHRFSVYGHRVFSAEDGGVVPSPVYCTILDRSGQYVLSGADDFLVKVWSVASGVLCATLMGHTAEICDMAFSPCMQYLVSLCSEDSSVLIWRRTSMGMFVYHRRLIEIDPKDFSKKLSPIFMEFSPSDSVPVSPNTLKLVVAYTNGCVVVLELLANSGKLTEFNRVVPGEKMELKSLALLPSSESLSCVNVLVGVSRQYSGKSILCFAIRSRGTPHCVEYTFPSAAVLKAPISHISVANSCASFVANDDELSSVYLFKDTGTGEFEKISLLRGQSSGSDTLLVDDASLSERFGISAAMRYSVDLTVFSQNDEFILCSLCGVRKHSVSIGEDDDSEIYCVLVFDAFTGGLAGVLGNYNRDHIFNLGPVETGDAMETEGWSYVFKGSYDGGLEFFKIKKSVDNALLIVSLSTFNINADDRGSNRPRSILDCHVRTTDEGNVVVATSDSKGSVSIFQSAQAGMNNISPPSEQFFHNDYMPLTASPLDFIPANNTRSTSVENGGILCDSRLVPLSQIQSPSPPIFFTPIHGTGSTSRYSSSLVEVQPCVQLKKHTREENKINNHIKTGPGRPRLTNEERIQREQRLANLAASRAALVADESDEYVRTASGRIVRRINDRFVPEDELDMYENSEIDDSSFTDSDEDSDQRPQPSRQSVRIRSRGRPSATNEVMQLDSPVRTIRVKRKSLKCDHCGSEREVDKTTYDEYTITGKRVRCRWLGFSCEIVNDDPISEPSNSSPQRRSSRLRELRR